MLTENQTENTTKTAHSPDVATEALKAIDAVAIDAVAIDAVATAVIADEVVTTEEIATTLAEAGLAVDAQTALNSQIDENLVTDANHSGTELLAAIDALDLDDESKTYVANQKKFYAGASEEGKRNIEKVLANRFLKQ